MTGASDENSGMKLFVADTNAPFCPKLAHPFHLPLRCIHDIGLSRVAKTHTCLVDHFYIV